MNDTYCPNCKSTNICWNWIHAFNGDRKAYEEANPHYDPKDLKDWGHECWDCENVFDTHEKVEIGDNQECICDRK